MKNVKHAKCVQCGKLYEAVPNLTNCTCGGILDIVYDYGYIKTVLSKEKLAAFPVEEQAITSAPASFAFATAIALARSFRDAVGLMPSSLMYSLAMPSSFASVSAV